MRISENLNRIGFQTALGLATFFYLGVGTAAEPAEVTAAQEDALLTLVDSLVQLDASPENADEIGAMVEKARKKRQAATTDPVLLEIDREIENLQDTLGSLQGQIDNLSAKIDSLINPEANKTASGAPTTPVSSVQTASLDIEGKVVFNTHIRPILSEKCFTCHGPAANSRKAGLRLDVEEGAFAALKGGRHALVPGNLQESSLFQRITTTDDSDIMPPTESEKPLTANEIGLIKRWIEEGATYQKHWSFITPTRPEAPAVQDEKWVKNPIDSFVLARLEKEGLPRRPEADKRSLLRRVSLDLTGLPPTLEELNDFLADDSESAYEKVVDRLLASPRYGEQMARYWLDVARYADTHGYHIDSHRDMWRWRDWVIDAFNNNKPFDEFTIEQFAGDLLPDPTVDQLVATGFNRNHMINFEGGAIPEEYMSFYIRDRVNTTGKAYLGLSVTCAQCHEHKYDPLTQEEYYQLYAFFNNVPEEGLDGRRGNAAPFIPAPRPHEAEELAELEEIEAAAKKELDRPFPELVSAQAAWEAETKSSIDASWNRVDLSGITSSASSTFEDRGDGSVLVGGENPDNDVYEILLAADKPAYHAIRLEAFTDDSLPKGGSGRADNTNFALSEFEVEVLPEGKEEGAYKVKFDTAYSDHSQDGHPVGNAIDGNAGTAWSILGPKHPENRTALFIPKDPIEANSQDRIRIRLRHESSSKGHGIGRFRLSLSTDISMAPSRLGAWYVNGPYKSADGKAAHDKDFGPEALADNLDLFETYEDGRFKWVYALPEYPDGKIHRLAGEVCATYLYRRIDSPTARTMTLSLGSNDSLKVWVNGERVHEYDGGRGIKKDQDTVDVQLKAGENSLLMKVVNYGGDYAFYFKKATEQVGENPFDIQQILAMEAQYRSEEQTKKLTRYYRSKNSPEWKNLHDTYAAATQTREEFEKTIPTTMVMKEMPEPRETFMLVRGEYDKLGEKVEAKIPSAFTPLPEGAPENRLGLAMWLVDESHPLTARVTVNRYWQQYFGTGIVETAEDFGSQGEQPSHPGLLDWLAVEFMESGWDVKHIQKLIVTSATYKQDSRITPEAGEADLQGRLFTRGPRFRMDAEMVRDSALAVSGLLVEKVGGPSVNPYQPEGLWKEVSYGAGFTAQFFEPGEGDDLYRRSMYTFWKRQCPPPGMLIFDAPNRETCTVRRARTNTPLQALALLNDPQFVEAARNLAEQAIKEAGETPESRIEYAFERATCRKPNAREMAILLDLYEKDCEEYKQDPQAAAKFIAVGESEPMDVDPVELAAWTNLAGTILNLDEVVSKG